MQLCILAVGGVGGERGNPLPPDLQRHVVGAGSQQAAGGIPLDRIHLILRAEQENDDLQGKVQHVHGIVFTMKMSSSRMWNQSDPVNSACPRD